MNKFDGCFDDRGINWGGGNYEVQDPCPGCKPGGTCRTPKCGRLLALQDFSFPAKPTYPSKYTASFDDTDLNFREMLLELLAVIHGDGGHYCDRYGIPKAVEDGINVVFKLKS